MQLDVSLLLLSCLCYSSVIETLTRCPGNACREEPYCTAGSETPCCERQSDRETESETEGLVRQKSGRHIHSIQGEEDKSSCFSVPEEPSAAWEQWILSNPPPQSGTITKRTLIHFSGQTAEREQRESSVGLIGGKTEARGTSAGEHLQSTNTINTSTRRSRILSSHPRIRPWSRARVGLFQHKVPAHVNTLTSDKTSGVF